MFTKIDQFCSKSVFAAARNLASFWSCLDAARHLFNNSTLSFRWDFLSVQKRKRDITLFI